MAGTLKSTPTRRPAKRAPATKRPAIPPEVLAPKPWSSEDVARLYELAARLAGRPVPGLRMTAAAFHDWCDPDVKAEWVDGEVILMSPEGWANVNFVTWLSTLLRMFVDDRELGVLMGREMLIRLPNQRRLRAPDLQFIAKERTSIIGRTMVQGAPDLAVESVSDTSVDQDYRDKHAEYAKAGIREYWVFDPIAQRVSAYALGRTKRYVAIPEADGKIASVVLKGFYFRPKWLHSADLPTVANVLKELGSHG